MRGMWLFILALVCGVSAVAGVLRWRSQIQPEVVEVETVDVIVAGVELFPNDQLSLELLATRKWPADLVPEGAVTDPVDAIDQFTSVQVAQGEPIFRSRLSGQPVGLMAKIKPGMRAISVLTPNYHTSVAGLIMPGQHVDVLLTRKQGVTGGVAETLLQNVVILAVDRQIRALAPGQDQGEQKLVQSVTLEVSPPQAERLSSAQMDGEILLVLRGADDEEILDTVSGPRSAEEEDLLLNAVGDLQKSTGRTNTAVTRLQEMFSQLITTLEENAAAAAAETVAEKASETEVESTADVESGPRASDIPVFTLRGNVWGYAMSRKIVPQTSYGSDRVADPATTN